MVRLHNENFLIYIFTEEGKYGNSIIFQYEQYQSWFQKSRYKLQSIIINTTYYNVKILNQVKGKFPGGGTTDTKTVNKHDLCYKCSIDGYDLPFVNLRVSY